MKIIIRKIVSLDTRKIVHFNMWEPIVQKHWDDFRILPTYGDYLTGDDGKEYRVVGKRPSSDIIIIYTFESLI